MQWFGVAEGDRTGLTWQPFDEVGMNHLSQWYVTTHITLTVNRVIYVHMGLWL
jgi:hypothetical protein